MNEMKGGNGIVLLFCLMAMYVGVYTYIHLAAPAILKSPPLSLPLPFCAPNGSGCFWCGEGTARAVGL